MVDNTELLTDLNVINAIITYDSQNVVIISCDERLIEYNIECYRLKDFQEVFIHSINGSYIEMNEIEQNTPNGDVICIPYNDNGAFRLLVLYKDTGEEIATLDCNQICGIKDGSKPISG